MVLAVSCPFGLSHMSWAPKGREGRSQEARRAPRLLVLYIYVWALSNTNRGQPCVSHQPAYLGSIVDCVSRPLEKMISVGSDKGSGVWQEVWKRWKDDDGGVRSCQLKLALHVRPAQSIATNLVSQQNYFSILCFTFLQSYIASNGQGSRHQIWLLGMQVSKAGAFRPRSRSAGWPVSPPLPAEDIQNQYVPLLGKPFSTKQPVPIHFLLPITNNAIKGLLIGHTQQCKYQIHLTRLVGIL